MPSLNCISVETAASVANLGAGYDCLAMAIEITNTYDLYFEDSERFVEGTFPKIEYHLTGAYSQYDEAKISGEGNLFVIAFQDACVFFFRAAGVDRVERSIFVDQSVTIPPMRGLGSSSSAAIAGVLAAAHFFWHFYPRASVLGFSREEFFDPSNKAAMELCVTIAYDTDNCPDNICACLKGGLTAAMVVDNRERRKYKQFRRDIMFSHRDLGSDLALTILVPENPIKTQNARVALPKEVLLSSAVSNIQRTAMTISCFEDGRYDLLAEAMWDELHQQRRASKLYRDSLDKRSLDLYGLLDDLTGDQLAYAACIGGAGSSLVAFSKVENAEAVKKRFRRSFENRAPGGWKIEEIWTSKPRNEPAFSELKRGIENDPKTSSLILNWFSKLMEFEKVPKRGWLGNG